MTDAELAILGLLSEKSAYDHELNKLIDARGLRRWTAIGQSSMYYVLDKLEKQGLIQKTTEKNGQRKFNISPAGVGVLQTSISDLLSTTRAHDKSFELGLANMSVLKTNQIQSALLSRQAELRIHIEKLREQLALEKSNGSFVSVSLFSHRLVMMEAELGWLNAFLVEWEAQAPVEPEPNIEPAIIPRSRQVILPQDPDSIHKQTTREIPPHKHQTPTANRTEIRISKASEVTSETPAVLEAAQPRDLNQTNRLPRLPDDDKDDDPKPGINDTVIYPKGNE